MTNRRENEGKNKINGEASKQSGESTGMQYYELYNPKVTVINEN